MDFLTLLSWAAAAIGTLTTMPQLVRMIRTKVTAGVSTKLWQLNLLCSIAWTSHGYIADVPAQMWPNLIMGIMQILVLWLVCQNEGLAWRQTMMLPLVGSLALIAVDMLLGPAVYGALALFPQITGQLSQLLVMRRATDLHGVSPAYLSLTLLAQGMWTVWGISHLDPATMFTCGPVSMVVACSLAYYMYRRIALVRARETVAVQIAA